MNTTPNEEMNFEKSENELELNNVTGRVSGFFNSILKSFFDFFQTLIHYKWISLFLFFLGIALGILSTINGKNVFKNEVIVATNYNSNEYLYSTLDSYNALIANAKTKNDSLLLSKISGIKTEPIPDAYQFLLSNYHNMQAFRILSDHGIDLEKYLKSKVAEKNYRYHSISFNTSVPKDSTQIVIDNFMNTLNETPYFNERKKFEKENIQNKRMQLQKSVDQLNDMFDNFGQNGQNANVSLNDYSNMNELFMSKEYLLNQINLLDVENLENDKVIYDVFQTINQNKSFFLPNFITFPLLLLCLFALTIGLRNKYRLFSKDLKK